MPTFNIRAAAEADVPQILTFIRELADYEQLLHQVHATEAQLHEELFGAGAVIEAVLACEDGVAVGFALFFHNFSTFAGKKGLYLEDLYISPAHRGKGYGEAVLQHLAQIAVSRNCARFEWWVLDWNAPSIAFYQKHGAVAMDDWTVFRVTGAALTALANGETR